MDTVHQHKQNWEKVGDLETAKDKVAKCRLEWLCHIARMPNGRIPKSALFGWLPQPRPRCGPRKRWRNVIKKDPAAIDVDENELYKEACQFRAGWRVIYGLELENHAKEQATTQLCGQAVREVVCVVCSDVQKRVTRGISVAWRGRNQCGSSMEPFSVQCAVDGSAVEEVWQFIGVDQDDDAPRMEPWALFPYGGSVAV